MKRRYRGRRRGVYVSPAAVVAAVAVLLAVLLLLRGCGGKKEEMADPSDRTQQGENAETQEPTGPTAAVEPTRPLVPVTLDDVKCVETDLAREDIHTGRLILVNNWCYYQFPDQQELVCVYEKKSDGYYVRDLSVYLAPEAMTALDAMLTDFRAQGGSKTINVVAGYRTAEDQQGLYERSAERNGVEHANKYVAKPGGSEHHTGLAVDFSVLRSDGASVDYDGTGEYAWINQNCHKYGFVVRYETGKEELTGIWDEPWHFRYVGIPHATEMVKQKMCMEEYMEYLRQFTFEGERLIIECAAGRYEVWYTRGTQVYLPESGEFEVSGNNEDGFIVTCKLSDPAAQ